MKGTIIQINDRNGLLSIQLENSDITIAELLDTVELNRGDIISGQLQELGDTRLYNHTTKEYLDVIIQNVGCNTTDGYK